MARSAVGSSHSAALRETSGAGLITVDRFEEETLLVAERRVE